MHTQRLKTWLEARSRAFWLLAGALLTLLIGWIDYITGADLALSLFYLLPIGAVAWYAGRNLGGGLAVFSAAVWLTDEYLTRHSPLAPPILLWNSAVHLGFFLIGALLLSALKQALEHERQLSRTDSLTGAANGRYFRELLTAEIERSRRYQSAFSLAFLDLDNFKTVNDTFGHSAGDQVLETTVQIMHQNLRDGDVVARLGGDEFAVLLPETNAGAARRVFSRLQDALLDEMQQQHCQVTFSIGIITCHAAGGAEERLTADELLKQADDLMYSVKRSGKDEIRYAVCANHLDSP